MYVDRGHYKLAWCGSACCVYDNIISPDGTICYMSPEVHRQMLGEEDIEVNYFQSDIFTLGMTMLHLVRLNLPSSISRAYRDSRQLRQAVESELCGLYYSSEFLNLLRRMLVMDPSERPQLEEIRLTAITMLSEDPLSLPIILPDAGPSSPSILLSTTKDLLSHHLFQPAEIVILRHMLARGGPAELATMERQAFALLYLKQGRYSESRRMLEETVLLMKDEEYWENIDLIVTLSEAYMKEGMMKHAETLLKRCLKLRNGQSEETHPAIINIYAYLGELYRLKQLHSDAETMLLHSLKLNNLLDPNNPNDSTVLILSFLGTLYADVGLVEEAEDLFRKSHAIVQERFGEEHPYMATAYWHLSRCYIAHSRFPEAEILIHKAIDITSAALGSEYPDITAYKYTLAQMYARQHRLTEAEALYIQCIDTQSSEFGEDNRFTAEYCTGWALNCLALGQTSQAKSILMKVLETYNNTLGEASYPATVASAYLAEAMAAEGELYEALGLLFKVLVVRMAVFGEISKETAAIYAQIASVYSQSGKEAFAASVSRKSNSILQQLRPFEQHYSQIYP